MCLCVCVFVCDREKERAQSGSRVKPARVRERASEKVREREREGDNVCERESVREGDRAPSGARAIPAPQKIKTMPKVDDAALNCQVFLFGLSGLGSTVRSLPFRVLGLGHQARRLSPILSHRMYLLISFRKSNPPQNRQLIIFISNSKQ